MRLATFNVENLFDRPKAMNLETWAEGKPHLEDFAKLNLLIQKDKYSKSVKDELLEIMDRHKGLITNGASEFIRLHALKGKFIYRPKGKAPQIVANGREDWIGWFELKTEPIKETAIENTARIIGLLDADIICLVEVEDRPGLKRFNDEILPRVNTVPYEHAMLIDGNDERGIDVGIMTRKGFDITRMCSHVDDTDNVGTIFSRDCAEYEITTPANEKILLLLNHFKSKGFGSYQKSAEKRLRQAKRVREIYEKRIGDGYKYIGIIGDLNETPDEWPMDPLIRENSTLTDVMIHPNFSGDGRPGTHGNGTKSGKFDYILMSPNFCSKVPSCGIERSGVWGGKNGTLFPHLNTIISEKDAASDHAALWIEADIH